MKGFAITIGFSVFLLVLFFGGVFANSTVPTFAAFCLWSPAMIAIGWTARGVNKRLVLVDNDQPPSQRPTASAPTPLTTNNRLSRLNSGNRQTKNEEAI